MSDLLDTAAAALGAPKDIVQRSAAARAEETGASVDDILAAWGGGAPIPAATATPAPDPAAQSSPVPDVAEPAAAVAVMDPPVIETPAVEVFAGEPEEPLEPVAIGQRIKTAVRVGAWTGGALGLVGFLLASAFWADTAAVLPDIGPVVQVDASEVLIGTILASLVFGAIVAGFSRAAASWANPAMQLSGSKSATAWVGAFLGVILGAVAGAVLANGFGTPIEGSEGLVQLPVLPTLAVMLIGGAVLGAITATAPQLFATPVAVDDADTEEVEAVRSRLSGAVGIPMMATVLLLLLVLPIGYLLIQSSHLTSGGASIVGIVIAAGILGFASLAGSKPEMTISFGELMIAVVGIGTVIIIILAVLLATGESEETPAEDHATAVVSVL